MANTCTCNYNIQHSGPAVLPLKSRPMDRDLRFHSSREGTFGTARVLPGRSAIAWFAIQGGGGCHLRQCVWAGPSLESVGNKPAHTCIRIYSCIYSCTYVYVCGFCSGAAAVLNTTKIQTNKNDLSYSSGGVWRAYPRQGPRDQKLDSRQLHPHPPGYYRHTCR